MERAKWKNGLVRLSWGKAQGNDGNDSTAFTAIKPESLEDGTTTRALIYSW